jgi:hypothetical protein
MIAKMAYLAVARPIRRARFCDIERRAPDGSRQGKTRIMAKQRISYVPLDKMDARMRAEMERCQREGTPRPESSAIRAHVPACFWFFAESWNNIYRNGILDHAVKELCRLYVSRSVTCEYCGNQRSVKATNAGALIEDQVLDLVNFEKSTKPSSGTSTPTTRSGTACAGISTSRNWSNSAA